MPSLCRSLSSAAVLCLLLAGCSKRPVARKDLRDAPDFALKDANGRTVHLSDYKGKVVLLDFWATWCGPCQIEIPWFIDFEQQYKNKGFAVLGVSMDEGGWDAVKPFVEREKMNYRVLMADDEVTQKYTAELQKKGGLDSLPTTLLIDRSGKIAAVHVGIEKSKNELRDEINQLLEGESAANGRAMSPGPALITSPK